MKARSDPLDLEWRTRNPQVGIICKLFHLEYETLEHILVSCNKIKINKEMYIHLQWPINNNKQELMN